MTIDHYYRYYGYSPRDHDHHNQLNGVKEWKATQPGGEGDIREIGFLPFPVEDVMCPGETKALHLYEVLYAPGT